MQDPLNTKVHLYTSVHIQMHDFRNVLDVTNHTFSVLSVKFSMSTYTSPAPQNHGQPVCLGISNSNLYIACSESDGASPACS